MRKNTEHCENTWWQIVSIKLTKSIEEWKGMTHWTKSKFDKFGWSMTHDLDPETPIRLQKCGGGWDKRLVTVRPRKLHPLHYRAWHLAWGLRQKGTRDPLQNMWNYNKSLYFMPFLDSEVGARGANKPRVPHNAIVVLLATYRCKRNTI